MLQRSIATRFRILLVTLLCLYGSGLALASTVVLDPAGPPQAEVVVLSDSRGDVTLEFRFGRMEVDTIVENGVSWVVPSIAGANLTSVSGFPELPELSVWIQLLGTDPQIHLLESDDLHRQFGTVRPAAEPLDRTAAADLRRIPNNDYYAGSESYPLHAAEIPVSGDLNSARVVLVTFHPVQYRAHSQEWTIHTRIRVRISCTIPRALDQMGRNSRTSFGPFARAILNPHPDTISDSSATPRLLLVTESQFLNALQPFIDWKNRSGVPVRTIIYSQAASSAETLRAYLRNLCQTLNPAPDYLLLVGEVSIIPPFFGVSSTLTDHPYSLLNDGDYLPDISVGRIPCLNATECSGWVNRLLAAERDLTQIPQPRGTVFSSQEYVDPQHGIYVTNLFTGAGMTVDQLQEPHSGTLSAMVNALNNGPSWDFYIGHGYAQGWSSVHPNFTSAEATSLTASRAPIIVSVACATADMDFPGSSLAESWVLRQNIPGALAYIGATENTPFFRSDTLGIGVLRAVFLQQCERLGPAVDLGRLAAAQCFPQAPGGLTEATIQQFVLLGDPSMRVVSASPQSITVTYPATMPVGTQNCTVTIQKNSSPVADAEVCLMSDAGELYVVRRSDTQGQAILPVDLANPVTLHLTVTARNVIPFQSDLHVIRQGGALPDVRDVRVVDPAGDNDGQADAAESAQLRLFIINHGNNPSLAGTAGLSCVDPRVQISNNRITVPVIAANDSLPLTPNFTLSVSDTVADLSNVLLRISLRADNGDSSVLIRPLILHAPRLVYIGSVLSEDSGNGDGNPDAGERLALDLRFVNLGSDRAASPVCSLFALPAGIDVMNPSWSSEQVASGDTVSVRYLLQTDASLSRGFHMEYSYQVTAQNALPVTGWDSQRIGRVPVFLYVLDPMPEQVDAVESVLTSLGVEYERGTVMPQELIRYTSIWVFCGIFPNKAMLPEVDAIRLSQYLDQHGSCYWEGGDVWVFDTRTVLHPYFHIRGVNDGTSNAGPVDGESGTAFSGMSFNYPGENSFIDQLAPETGAITLLRNVHAGTSYAVAIGYSNLDYRTVGSSIELGSLADGESPSTRIQLFREILNWFHIESRADSYPPVIQHEPVTAWPQSGTAIPLIADVIDASGLLNVDIEYHIGDGPVRVVTMAMSDGRYRGELPGWSYGTEISYRIRATDNSTLHNMSETLDNLLTISALPQMPYQENFSGITSVDLYPAIHAGDSCSWSLTNYPETVPVLELHGSGSASSGISYTTDAFDCSRLTSAYVSFQQFLRDGENNHGSLARVTASTDGGLNWPYDVWDCARQGTGVLDEGMVISDNLPWMAGQSSVMLRFEFFGKWYWRLWDIKVQGETAPVTKPVRDLVICPVPEGIRLLWSKVPDALAYSILATSTSLNHGLFEPIAEVYDTSFIDTDMSFMSRFYQANAILERGITPWISGQPQPMQRIPAIRLQDLNWNSKINSRLPR